MLRKVCPVIRIHTKIEWVLPWGIPHPATKFRCIPPSNGQGVTTQPPWQGAAIYKRYLSPSDGTCLNFFQGPLEISRPPCRNELCPMSHGSFWEHDQRSSFESMWWQHKPPNLSTNAGNTDRSIKNKTPWLALCMWCWQKWLWNVAMALMTIDVPQVELWIGRWLTLHHSFKYHLCMILLCFVLCCTCMLLRKQWEQMFLIKGVGRK